ncbi:MAG: ABC transporter ATP-binding protein [Desulfotignum sp.]|jgi:biotin transport system ATP-binding protein|nr:ABC transporter ATP-binding protein [Desulfotignum sp.]
MDHPILEIDHLTHLFTSGGGIQNISFQVFPKEYILVAGPNGCGKTTLIRHLNGLLLPASGDVRLHGKPVKSDITTARRTVGMVFQDADTQIVGDTVYDEVAFGPENLKMPRHIIQQKVMQTLARLDLSLLKDRNPATLSGGEKRRLTIAGILVMDPEIIVLDEPFANLDHPSSISLIKTIQALNQGGQTIIMATHDLEEVITCATRMLILDRQGCLARDGRPGDLLLDLAAHGIKEPCFFRMGYSAPPWQA